MKTPPSLSWTLRAAARRSNSAGLDSMMCIQQRILGRWYGLTTVSHSSVAPRMSGYWNFQYRMSSMRWSAALTLPASPMATPIAS